MGAYILPYNDHVLQMCIGCITTCSLTILVLTWVLATFLKFRNRVDCSFNRYIVAFCAVQLIQSLQKATFSAVTIINEGLPFILCDINASLDQFLDFTAMLFIVCFFAAMSNPRRYWESGWNTVAYVFVPTIGAISLGTVWAIVADRKNGVTYQHAPYFKQTLAWCWLSNNSDDLNLVNSKNAMEGAQFFLGYTPIVLLVIVSIYSYTRQKCRTGETWLGKGIILKRFLGMSIFPVAMYVIGMPIRIALSDASDTVSLVISVVYPMLGTVVGVVFLWTEGGLWWLARLCVHSSTMNLGDLSEPLSTTLSPGPYRRSLGSSGPPSYNPEAPSGLYSPRRSNISTTASPRRSGLAAAPHHSWLHSEEAVPTSFTATMRTMMCDSVIGQHIQSSRPSIPTRHYHRGRALHSERASVCDSMATTETNFGGAMHDEDDPHYYTTTDGAVQIVIDPGSQRNVENPNADLEELSTSAKEMRTTNRMSETSLRSSQGQFTTRSERSQQFTAHQVRVSQSLDTPSSSLLMSYRNSSHSDLLPQQPTTQTNVEPEDRDDGNDGEEPEHT